MVLCGEARGGCHHVVEVLLYRSEPNLSQFLFYTTIRLLFSWCALFLAVVNPVRCETIAETNHRSALHKGLKAELRSCQASTR